MAEAVLGELLAREEGKSLPEAIGEAGRAGMIFKFFAGEAVRLAGERIEVQQIGGSGSGAKAAGHAGGVLAPVVERGWANGIAHMSPAPGAGSRVAWGWASDTD